MKRLTKGIHHISLKCTDLDNYNETIRFYHELYGMEIIRTWTLGEEGIPACMLETGGGLLEISANATERLSAGALRHIALHVDSVDECIEIARSAGYPVTMEPKDICFNSEPPYPARVAFCLGPVGEEVEFFELR